MRILAIDTSTMLGSVALTEGGTLVAEEQLGVEVTHSERLLFTIDHLLDAARWPKESLDGIAVAIGPGSFTGLRIGLATAKGLALGLSKPIAGVSSLFIAAHNCLVPQFVTAAVIDARRGEVYASAYRSEIKKGRLKAKMIMDEMVIDPKLLCRKLKSVPGKILFAGGGVIAYEKTFRSLLKEKAVFPSSEAMFPHASYLASIAHEKFMKGKGDDIAGLTPNYIRRSDAEIGFMGKAKKR